MTGSSDAPGSIDETLAAAEALDAEIQGPPPGAPGAPEPGPEPTGPDTAEVLAAVIAPAFAILAPAWAVQPPECKALADAWAPVIDKYFPGLSIGVELNAALVTLAIIGPRLGKPPKPTAAPAKKSGQASAPASTIPPGFENEAA